MQAGLFLAEFVGEAAHKRDVLGADAVELRGMGDFYYLVAQAAHALQVWLEFLLAGDDEAAQGAETGGFH